MHAHSSDALTAEIFGRAGANRFLVSGSVVAAFLRAVVACSEATGTSASDPESLASDERSLNWSDLAESKRSLALLEHLRLPGTAYVYSGEASR